MTSADFWRGIDAKHDYHSKTLLIQSLEASMANWAFQQRSHISPPLAIRDLCKNTGKSFEVAI
jgi:hypothetical protein